MLRKRLLLIAVFIGANFAAISQDRMIDQIVAVVGSNIILKSDIERSYREIMARGQAEEGDMKCQILEHLLTEKLLMAEAELDTTIEAMTPGQLNQELSNHMQHLVKSLGSERAVEAYFHKPIAQLRASFEEELRNAYLTGEMQKRIIKDVRVTPAEVRYSYRNMASKDIPVIPEQVEYAQISFYPQITLEEENKIKDRLREFKKRVEEGDNFTKLAVMYSEDPGSAPNGGEIGYMTRANLDPAYAAAAFNLRELKISNVVKSDFGYHIIQQIGRRGDEVNTRHILLKPHPSAEARQKALSSLDSLVNFIQKGDLKFDEAAFNFSSDKESRNNGGLAINTLTGASKWALDELPPDISRELATLQVGQLSKPFQTTDEKERVVFKVIKLISRTKEHKANVQEDYQALHDELMQQKRETAISDFIAKQQSKTYIHIDETYQNCNFKYTGWQK
ncbi:MAG: peptidylprolyl isomerase [Bacteroidales bacterium]|nr:peptidylprolyl isomerase [Bacteroidales bacterium]